MKAAESETTAVGKPAADKTAQSQQKTQAIRPHEVVAALMARMNLVNTKKDELTLAIRGLTDFTQTLAKAYAGQMQVIQQLANRVKALEVTAGGMRANANGADSPAAAAPGT